MAMCLGLRLYLWGRACKHFSLCHRTKSQCFIVVMVFHPQPLTCYPILFWILSHTSFPIFLSSRFWFWELETISCQCSSYCGRLLFLSFSRCLECWVNPEVQQERADLSCSMWKWQFLCMHLLLVLVCRQMAELEVLHNIRFQNVPC